MNYPMQRLVLATLVVLSGLWFQNCSTGFQAPKLEIQSPVAVGLGDQPPSAQAKSYFFGFAKAKLSDPEDQQERAIFANNLVASALSALNIFEIRKISENVATIEMYRQDPSIIVVTKPSLLAEFMDLKNKLTPQDTVVIYSHTHGKDNPDGGLIIGSDLITWSEYAEVVASLPAKNVVVITMACFSGNLIDQLKESALKPLWENRTIEGRNFVAISSQNSDLTSDPAIINGALLNPLPYAFSEAVSGKADGYEGLQDGVITFEELTKYTLMVTGTAGIKNINEPQMVGAFEPSAIFYSSKSAP
jgi:hypothetical protein